ncbi:MAG: hypothetical protein WBF89_20535 [Steroidobacteraceae bacterium]
MNNPQKQPNTPAPRSSDHLVAMLGVISSQIEAALHETDAPAAVLVETAHSISKATETLAKCIFDFSGQPVRVFQDLMVLHDDLHARSGRATSAIQFHDRLVQCLTHVCASLTCLSEFISTSKGPRSAAEWNELRERVRGIHSMEQERALFDLFSGGASEDEKKAAIAKHQGSAGGAGKVELF